MLVRQVVDSKLAQFAYLVGCPRSGEALVIDPERDVDRYFEEAARHNLRIVAAVDTHIHADYLSGLREMAERGVLVYASKEGGPDWQYEWLTDSGYPHRLLADGDRFAVGFIEFQAVHTPGHTPEHLSYLVRDAEELRHRPDSVVVLDTRPRQAFSEGHLAGAILAELDFQFCAIAGSYVDESTPIYLLVEEARLEEAVRALVRVGLDRIAGYATPGTLVAFAEQGGPLVRTAVIDMAQMEAQRLAGEALVLDVRGGAEFAAGHVPGAIHIPHTRVRSMLETIPSDTRILVHCNSGARAAAAVSLLERHGFAGFHVDDQWANYRQTAATVDAQL